MDKMNGKWNLDHVVSNGDYLFAKIPEHPLPSMRKYVMLHRAVAENAIGYIVPKGQYDVHHKNGDAKDNRAENLSILTSYEHGVVSCPQRGHCFQCPVCGLVFLMPSKRFTERITQYRRKGKAICCSNKCSRIANKRGEGGTKLLFKYDDTDNPFYKFLSNQSICLQ